MEKRAFVYILFSMKNGTLYIGVTSDLKKRVWEHKNKVVEGFTKRYNVNKLGWYEIHPDIMVAIEREKQLKNYSRKKKIALIEELNPDWNDLYETLF